METIACGVVGPGLSGIGGEHLRALVSLSGVEVTALCSLDEEELQEAAEAVPGDVATYTDTEQFFEAGLDAAAIATPNHTHEEICKQAFDAGVDVLCEKPLAPTLEGCDAIIEAAEASDCLLQVGLHRRYSRLYRRLNDLREGDEFGDPTMLWSQEFRGDWSPNGMVEDEDLGQVNWRYHRKYSGGSLVEKNCHDFDVFNWLADAEPARVMAVGGTAAYEGRDTLDHAIVTVVYENGVKALLQLGLFVPHGFHGRYAGLVGDAGSVEVDEGSQQLQQYFRDRPDEVSFKIPDDEDGHGHGVYNEEAAFVECVRTDEHPFADGRIGRASVAVARAAQRSIRSGEPVDIPGDEEYLEERAASATRTGTQ